MIWALLACAAEALDGAPAIGESRAFDPSRVPVEAGIYRLHGDELTPLPHNTTLATALASAQPPQQYPLVLPAAPPTVAPGDLLLLVGAGVETWSVATLIPTPQLPSDTPRSEAGPWYVLGSGTATVARAVQRPTPTDPPARTLAAGSLPAGRYVLSGTDSARALLFETTGP